MHTNLILPYCLVGPSRGLVIPELLSMYSFIFHKFILVKPEAWSLVNDVIGHMFI